MTQPTNLRNDLETKDNLEWFDAITDILKKDKHPTTYQIMQFVGTDKPNPANEVRGSRFLIPYDKRFKWACINPDVKNNEIDKPLDNLSFGGEMFSLKMTDIIKRFPVYRTQRNIYDGGTQIFFYPVPSEYEFSALDFWIRQEPEEIENINELIFHSVTFKFGDQLLLGRDGYHMKR
jgi:hypothetical protein